MCYIVTVNSVLNLSAGLKLVACGSDHHHALFFILFHLLLLIIIPTLQMDKLSYTTILYYMQLDFS